MQETSAVTYTRIVLERTGDVDALCTSTAPVPTPRPGEVLVRVLAAGVAFAQVLMRRGVYAYAPPFPFTPGAEVAGEIVAVGPDVHDWTVGERVVAFTGTGGYAELAAVPAGWLVRVPEGVDAVAAAALPMNYVTAHQLLHRVAQVRAGETVLVHGASGGVGTALLQLARLAGVRAIGTASAGNLDLVRSLGGIAVDYRSGDVADQVQAITDGGADVALDPLGGEHVLGSVRALRRNGRLVVYGYAGPGAATPAAQATLRERMAAWNAERDGIRAMGYSLGALFRESPHVVRDDLAGLVTLLANGDIAPVIAEQIPLSEVRRAHQRLEQGGVQGKIVLVPDAASSGTSRA